MAQKVLITGCSGYLGSTLGVNLKNEFFDLVISSSVDKSSQLKKYFNGFEIRNYDFDNIESCLKLCKGVDIVIHASGMNSIDCEKDPTKALIINGYYTANLVNACIANNVKKIIYLSTAHVYSDKMLGFIDEEVKTTNLHPYATSHIIGENQVMWASNQEKIQGVVLRLSNVFGNGHIENYNSSRLFINNICVQAVVDKEIVLRSSSNILRNFIPVSEFVNVIKYILYNHNIYNTVLNIGGTKSYSLYEMACIVASRAHELFGIHVNIKHFFIPFTNQTEFNYSVAKLRNFGFKFQVDVQSEVDNILRKIYNSN